MNRNSSRATAQCRAHASLGQLFAYLSETSALHSDSTLAIAIHPLGPSPFSLRLHVGQQQSGCCAIALEHVSEQCKTIPSPPPDVANAAYCLVVLCGAAS